MPELNLQNISQIINDVSREEIIFPLLREELTDHICCDVEYEMRNGMSFREAYDRVKEKMGDGRLKKIQEETLYAVDTKYRHMKKTIQISGIAGTVMLGFAALFKIMHWPGGAILIMLGAISIAFVLMPSALVVLWKETHSQKRISLYLAAFLTGMCFITGIVFKVQHWPGAAKIMGLAAVSAIFFFIPLLLIHKLKNTEKPSKRGIYYLGATGMTCYIAGFLFKIQHWPFASLLLMAGLTVTFFVVIPWYTYNTWKDEKNVSARFIFIVIGSVALVIPSVLINLNLQSHGDGQTILMQTEQIAPSDSILKNGSPEIVSDADTLAIPLNEKINK